MLQTHDVETISSRSSRSLLGSS